MQDKKPEESIQSYEDAFQKIKQATGMQDIDKLVNRFIEVEDQNFSLFNYVNELNNEIELLQEKVPRRRRRRRVMMMMMLCLLTQTARNN